MAFSVISIIINISAQTTGKTAEYNVEVSAMKKSGIKLTFYHCYCVVILIFSAFSMAEKETSQTQQLGKELTPMGANPAANADNSIPAWTGTIKGLPSGLEYAGSGTPYPDPYAAEKKLFSIDSSNVEHYKNRLSAGMVALIEKYPQSFRMDVYPSHRDFRYHEQMEMRTQWNVGRAKLVGGNDGLQNMTGGAPFPIPQNGAEAIWNARINQPTPVADALTDSVAVYADGKSQRERAHVLFESPYAYQSHPVGTTGEDIGPIAGYLFVEMIEPSRKKGEMAIIHEPLDQVKNKRKAWVYIPGAQRVKVIPNAGYDTPIGPGGLMTADDSLGFNGGMDRYNWQLIGKQEMFIPFHAYRFDEPGLALEKLLPGKHINPDYMRYELQRVWVVEATLRERQRHVYRKRRFYISEDNWLIVATEAYDARGQLWRVGLQNTLYDFFLQGYITRAHIQFDLQADAYVALGLVNQTRPTNYAMEVKGHKFYSSQTLLKKARN
jgi:hypothetical protein